ncbi:MAG: hypothetical protein VX627_00605 [Candidatus Thermoplasmatota archaeon]|nr:hypothetical protein [Candidatus Thermoplasmatota archaeon]
MSHNRMLPLILATLMLMGFAPLVSSAPAPMNGGPYAVTSDETWDVDGELNAQVVIESGSTLTIEANLTVAEGASITVNQGATLRLENGGLIAEAGPHGVRPVSPPDGSGDASLLVHSGVSSGAFTVRIVTADGSDDMDGWTVQWDELPAQDMSGSVHEINFSTPKSDFRIHFDFPMGTGSMNGNLMIDRIEVVDSNSATHSVLAIDAEPMDCMLVGDDGFPLTIDGTAHIENSMIRGADVAITGAVTTDSATFMASGPIMVTGGDASLDMLNGAVTLSRVDHDVELDAFADITWGAAQGTGGLIDRWERIAPEMTVHIPVSGYGCGSLPCVRYVYHGLGGPNVGASSIQAVNSDGNVTIGQRTIEIGWADSTDVWTESATIEIERFRTAWNMNSTMDDWSNAVFVPMPRDVTVFNILEHLEYPIISVDSTVVSSDEGTVGKSIPVHVTVTNSGTGNAGIAVSCYLPDSDNYADASPRYSSMLLGTGETETIVVNWSFAPAGSSGLECRVHDATQFLDIDAFIAKRGASLTLEGSSDPMEVTWIDSEEEGFDAMLVLGSVILTIIICMGIVVRLAQQGAFGGGANVAEIDEFLSEEYDVDDEGEERVDRFAQMMEDEDED